jgi:hypothetical protein
VLALIHAVSITVVLAALICFAYRFFAKRVAPDTALLPSIQCQPGAVVRLAGRFIQVCRTNIRGAGERVPETALQMFAWVVRIGNFIPVSILRGLTSTLIYETILAINRQICTGVIITVHPSVPQKTQQHGAPHDHKSKKHVMQWVRLHSSLLAYAKSSYHPSYFRIDKKDYLQLAPLSWWGVVLAVHEGGRGRGHKTRQRIRYTIALAVQS